MKAQVTALQGELGVAKDDVEAGRAQLQDVTLAAQAQARAMSDALAVADTLHEASTAEAAAARAAAAAAAEDAVALREHVRDLQAALDAATEGCNRATEKQAGLEKDMSTAAGIAEAWHRQVRAFASFSFGLQAASDRAGHLIQPRPNPFQLQVDALTEALAEAAAQHQRAVRDADTARQALAAAAAAHAALDRRLAASEQDAAVARDEIEGLKNKAANDARALEAEAQGRDERERAIAALQEKFNELSASLGNAVDEIHSLEARLRESEAARASTRPSVS